MQWQKEEPQGYMRTGKSATSKCIATAERYSNDSIQGQQQRSLSTTITYTCLINRLQKQQQQQQLLKNY